MTQSTHATRPSDEINVELIQEMIDDLKALKDEAKGVICCGVDLYLNGLCEAVEEEVAVVRGAIAAAKATTEKELVTIAVEQIMRWWHESWGSADYRRPPVINDQAVSNAVSIVLHGREFGASSRIVDVTPVVPAISPLINALGGRALGDTPERMRIHLAVKAEAQRQADAVVTESHRLHAIRGAKESEQRDRELLLLPAEGELDADTITAAQAAAEAKAGPAKNGKPYPRFATAAERLLLLTEWELVEA